MKFTPRKNFIPCFLLENTTCLYWSLKHNGQRRRRNHGNQIVVILVTLLDDRSRYFLPFKIQCTARCTLHNVCIFTPLVSNLYVSPKSPFSDNTSSFDPELNDTFCHPQTYPTCLDSSLDHSFPSGSYSIFGHSFSFFDNQ